MLAGTALHIVPSEQSATELPQAQYFAIPIHTNDGVERCLVLQISTSLLTTLTSAMFGEPDDSLSDEQCQDAGKELANILSSCCIQHISEMVRWVCPAWYHSMKCLTLSTAARWRRTFWPTVRTMCCL